MQAGEQHSSNIINNINGTLSEAGRSRRKFLKLLGGATLVGLAASTLSLKEHQVLAAGDDFTERSFPGGGLYTSKVYPVGSEFNLLGVYWEVASGDGKSLDIQVRVSSDGSNFSDWVKAEEDSQESKDNEANPNRFYSSPILYGGSFVQYKVNIVNVSLKLVGITFINSTDGPTPPKQPTAPTEPVPGPTEPFIIKRAQWGANEALRYDKGVEIWPREYRSAKAIVVHHSETSNVYNADPASDIRGIYYYHAVTKGWGDIGYNYLIDWKGQIYEGRVGGDDVVGGHAYQYNYGSVGICLIGSFKTVVPTAAQQDALVKLMAWRAYKKGINPTGQVFLVDKTVNCISGHRQVIDTSCPGDAAFAQIGSWRQKTAERIGSGTTSGGTYAADLVSVKFGPTTITANGMMRVEAMVKNTGTMPLETQQPAPEYIYEEGKTFETQGFDKVNNKFRVAIDFVGNSGVSHPYRWGLGNTLHPGQQTTVVGYIKLRTKATTDYFGGVVQEYVKYHDDNVGRQTISVLADNYPTLRAPDRSGNPNVRYFNETGHNLGYGFRLFWEKNGGLPIFGYPLTEEFQEVSPTDNKVYTVQYFERNRFEYHPEFVNTPYTVLLGLLGNQLTSGRNFPKSAPFNSTPDKVYLPQTGHSLGGAFLRYWNKYGGLSLFGYAISEELQEKNPDDGKTYTVQYFERNRFEYHPEYAGTPNEVLLGLLGKQVLRDRGWLQPGV